MLSTGFLKVLGGAFDAVARGLTNVPALPAPEPESDGDALAIATVDALVPRDINEVVHENAWQCVKVMEVNSRGMQGNLGDAIKKLVMTYASATLKKHRHLVLQGSNRQSWEYCCCSIKKGCRYRAKGVLEKGPTGDMRDMPSGGTVEVEGGQTCDFARVVGLLGSFRMLTKLSNPYPGCRARWQCWSCDDGVKKGVCKHALIHTKRAGLCSLPKEFRHLTGGVKRKRGAPRKTAPALSVQLGDYLPAIASAQPALEAGDAEVPALPAPEPRVTRSRGRVDISGA